MKINERSKIEYVQVVLEKDVDFNQSDLEIECQSSLGHRRFKQSFISEFPNSVGFDKVVKIGMCSIEQTLVNATLIKYL